MAALYTRNQEAPRGAVARLRYGVGADEESTVEEEMEAEENDAPRDAGEGFEGRGGREARKGGRKEPKAGKKKPRDGGKASGRAAAPRKN